MKTTVVINKCILYTVHDGMQSCGIKFCTFCRIWCYHFCCSPTKRGAPRSDVWKAESPTKRLCLPRSLNALGRLLKGQPPSWVHTGLTASLMNVKCHTKHENRPSLYCSSSSHQKSVSADDKSKHNKPTPSSPEPTS